MNQDQEQEKEHCKFHKVFNDSCAFCVSAEGLKIQIAEEQAKMHRVLEPIEIEMAEAEKKQGDKTVVTTGSGNVVELQEQPKPKFTIIDLEQALSKIFTATMTSRKMVSNEGYSDKHSAKEMVTCLNEANSLLQELIATIDRIKSDLDIIDMPSDVNAAVTTELNTERVAFNVCGVQLFENGQIVGTSLYSTVVKARKIRDVLNAKFAELRVKHEAKIVNYPVY